MSGRYINQDGSEMTREEIIALLEKEMEGRQKDKERICQLLNDKRAAYINACKADYTILRKAKLYNELPDELKDDETAKDIQKIDGALDVMQYMTECIYNRVPSPENYDENARRYSCNFTKGECEMMHNMIDGTFEDACLMFTYDLDWYIDKKILVFERDSTFYNVFFNGLKLQWKMIMEQLDCSAGLRALFG